MTEYESGIVKWFDSVKGYGFIERFEGGEVYVHYSAIRCDESDCELHEGVRVRFLLMDGPRGMQAQEVIVEH